jgi:hypothetical protein
MSNHETNIEVVMLAGEGGAVHVRTPEEMEPELVDKEFKDIAQRIGQTTFSADELPEPPAETNTDAEYKELGKMGKEFRNKRGIEKPPKAKK